MQRRNVLSAAAAIVASAGVPARAQAKLKPIVLVHGAGHGGWCWRDVRNILQKRGFEVYTPTLTGLGEKVHLRTPSIGLYTHITDIVNLIDFEELDRVVLVGHSYAGAVITGACDARKSKMAHIIDIDGSVPEDGETSFIGASPEDIRKRYGNMKDGYLVPLSLPGLGFPDPNTEQAKWVARHLTEHMVYCWMERIKLPNGGTNGVPRTYVQCAPVDNPSEAAKIKLSRVRGVPTWEYIEKLGPHNVMVTDPEWTANLIASKAG